MNFVKGIMFGMVAGTIIGVMNSETIMYAANRGMKKIKKMKRKYRF